MDNQNISEEVRETERSKNQSYTLPFSVLIAGVLIAWAVVYSGGHKSSNGIAPSPAGGEAAAPSADLAGALKIGSHDVILGDSKAPVTFIEYGDYQCPYCGKVFTQVEPQLRQEYITTGKVKMVYRNFQFLGDESTNAGAAAECAKDQNKFWAYHDALYTAEIKDGKENSGNLNRNLFMKLAGDVGLDVPSFTSCYDSNKYVAQIKKEQADADAIGVNSTPTNYINGQVVQGAQPYSVFKTAIEMALTAK